MFTLVPLAALTLLASSTMADPRPVSVMQTGGTPRVLVYTRTLGYRHESIPVAIDTLRQNGGGWGVSFDFTEDPTMFVDDTLKTYDGVMFVSTSEEVLDSNGQAALARFFQSGGVFTGVHSASACLYHDTNFLQVVGAYFDYHPSLQQATFVPTNKSHPATEGVPDRWTFNEEVYYLRSDPRTVGAKVILTVDESSYHNDAGSGGNYPSMGDPHPIAWYIESPESAQPLQEGAPKAGRSFYTSLGHENSTWQNETFIQHVMNGLTWALDGASTKAYNVGIVGNQSVPVAAKPSASAASGSAGASASGTGKPAASGTSASAAGTGAPASESSKASSATAIAAAIAPALAAGLVALAAVL